MNRNRLLVIAAMSTFAPAALAQQTAAKPGGNPANSGATPVETHLKVLTEKLDLTADQQAKTRPILQEMHDTTQTLMQDESMSCDQRMEKVRDSHQKADKRIRAILNDDQKRKLDQLEAEPHPELHETPIPQSTKQPFSGRQPGRQSDPQSLCAAIAPRSWCWFALPVLPMQAAMQMVELCLLPTVSRSSL